MNVCQREGHKPHGAPLGVKRSFGDEWALGLGSTVDLNAVHLDY